MQLDIMSVDNLVLCSNNQDRNVSEKSVTMRGTTFQVVPETFLLKLEFLVHVQLRFLCEMLQYLVVDSADWGNINANILHHVNCFCYDSYKVLRKYPN